MPINSSEQNLEHLASFWISTFCFLCIAIDFLGVRSGDLSDFTSVFHGVWKQLNANVEEHQKLLEKIASDKVHHEALEADFRKLEELITVSETTIREERETKKKLVEETKQVKETIELLREMCKSLEDQVVQSKETAEEANIARAKQYKELEALKVMAQVQGERCQMLEEKMLATESSMKEEREAKQKLSQEVDQLQERLQRSMEELARPPSGEQMRLLVGTYSPVIWIFLLVYCSVLVCVMVKTVEIQCKLIAAFLLVCMITVMV